MRYVVQLDYQIALDATENYEPAIGNIFGISGGVNPQYPVEIDWARNRLYFAASDAVIDGPIPALNQVQVTYKATPGKIGDPAADRTENHFVRMVDEEVGPSGKTFGNLTNIAVNESQVGAFKDPWDNKVWVFWTSTRAGNPDLYYETISPLFTGVQLKAQ